MNVFKPDHIPGQEITNKKTLFLAGSITDSDGWQEKVVNEFIDYDITIFNPRRDQWDSSWVQDESNPEFNHQVNWELDKLEISNIIFMYFDPNTKSPISLMELGAFKNHPNIIVCCPDGFWRKGNVQILCTREKIPLYNNFNSAIGALRTKLHKK
jgi:hypothetical protein